MRDFLAATGLFGLPDCCPHWGPDEVFLPGYCSLALGAAMVKCAAMARCATRSDSGQQPGSGTPPERREANPAA